MEKESLGTGKREVSVESGGGNGEENIDGKVAVIQGKLKVWNPRGNGAYPTLTLDKGVQVFLNGSPVEGTIVVSEEDDIEIMLPQQPPEISYEIKVSEDKFTAFIKVEKKVGYRYHLQDFEPCRNGILRVSKEEIEPELPPVSLVVNDLRQRGIILGIDVESIRRAFTVDVGKEIVVARGMPVTPPRDEEIDYIFLEKQKRASDKLSAENNERIDFRERKMYFSVEPGEVLAVKLPARPGIPGFNVYGQKVDPPLPKPKEIKVRDNVQLVDKGRKAVAVKSGRPVLRNGYLCVLPLLVIEGNVDMKSGNINFKGDVVITGNVLEGMKVQATGMVEVLGSVMHAFVYAGDSVVVKKNIIGSFVCAGGMRALYEKGSHLLEKLNSELEEYKPFVTKPEKISPEKVKTYRTGVSSFEIKQKNLKKLASEIRKFLDWIWEKQGVALDEYCKECFEEVENLLKRVDVVNVFENIGKIIGKVEEIITYFNSWYTSEVSIRAAYCHNAILESSGKVEITGKGCYHSEIWACGDVTVKGYPGVFRGGQITARGNVFIKELGCPAETKTVVRVSSGRSIRADKVYPNSVLQVGLRSKKVQTTMQFVDYKEEENETKVK